MPLKLYRYYGDIRILQTRYQFMLDYINYLINRAAGKPYLLDGGLGDWETLGELPPFLKKRYILPLTPY